MIELGPYLLLRRFSVGGMAELFLALHREDREQRPLLVKRILPQLATRSDVVRMFLDEGRLTSHLHHENLVQVFDVGQVDGTPFIVLEYVDGMPLSELLRRQPGKRIPNALACWLLAEICAGLAYAHERTDLEGNPLGIVHRDVSPDNILLSRGGEVKLVDFGIAKAASQLARTRPGQVKGKLAYMSPEQLRNSRIDARSDLFSLGLVLYEATVGRRAFPVIGEVDLLRALLNGDYAPPERELPGYPPELARIVAGCLAVDVERRYQKASELRRALLALVPDGSWASELADRVEDAIRGISRADPADSPETASFLVLDERDLESLRVEARASAITTAPGRKLGPPPVPRAGSGVGEEPDTTVIPKMASITRVEPFPPATPHDPDTVPEVSPVRDALRESELVEDDYLPDEDTVRDLPTPGRPGLKRR